MAQYFIRRSVPAWHTDALEFADLLFTLNMVGDLVGPIFVQIPGTLISVDSLTNASYGEL